MVKKLMESYYNIQAFKDNKSINKIVLQEMFHSLAGLE